MNKKMVNRIIIYVAGLLVLALGIILNTEAGLGVSPIISEGTDTGRFPLQERLSFCRHLRLLKLRKHGIS